MECLLLDRYYSRRFSWNNLFYHSNIINMKIRRHRGVKNGAQGHTASEVLSQDSHAGRLAGRARVQGFHGGWGAGSWRAGTCPTPTVSQGPNFLEDGVGLDWHEVRWGDKA